MVKAKKLSEFGDDEEKNGKISMFSSIFNISYFHELPQAEEERLEKLFNSLDKDGNGKIDIHDLSEALKDSGLARQYAEVY